MKRLVTAITAALAITSTAMAADLPGKTSVSVNAGTLGLGIEMAHQLPIVNLTGRLAWNGYGYEFDDSIDGIDYDLDLDLSSVTAIVDWRPWGQFTHLSAGLVFNGNEIGAMSVAAANYEVGGMSFAASDVGNLAGSVKFDDVAPYVGLGWNIPVAPSTALSLELGVVFQGSPQLSLSADGALADDPVFQAELEAERQKFQDEISSFEYYPVIELGFQRKF